jgi:hypothetical protein
MALMLKTVQASQGTRWIGDAFRLFARRPLAFTLMALSFFVLAMLLRLLPTLAAPLPLLAAPLLSLGFMVAAQSALLDGPVSPRQFIEPLLGDKARRRSLLILCGSYAVAMLVVMVLADAASGSAWDRLQALDKSRADFPALMEPLLPELGRGALVLAVLASLVSVPFWYAPALVHWAGQGAKHALFSSTVALWRTRSAFLLFMMGWTGLVLLASVAVAVLSGVLGSGMAALVGLVLQCGMMVLSAVFYLSVLFGFNDTFGGTAAADPPGVN